MAKPADIDVTILRRNRVFGILEDGEMEEVLGFAKLRRFNANDRIFAKGDIGDCMYAILRGKIAVQTESDDAKVILLNILDEGDVFGEIAMLDGKERSATTCAQEPCTLLRVDRVDFMPFLQARPGLCIRLMGVLCERVRWTSAIIEDQIFLNVTRRLAKRILVLAQNHGRKSPEGIRIGTFVSQEDLANMLGVSREIVNKTLKGFVAAGAISYTNRGYLIVQDQDYLERLGG